MMSQANIQFTREGIEGVASIGTLLIDAARRIGVRSLEGCDVAKGDHHCAVNVTLGNQFLSQLSPYEKELFGDQGGGSFKRLACFASIAAPGEIAIMTDQKAEEPSADETKDKFVEDFQSLPLEKKLASLVRMEMVTIGETLQFVVNSPFKVLEKVGDVLAEFGMKIEAEAKKASQTPPATENGSSTQEHTAPTPGPEDEADSRGI